MISKTSDFSELFILWPHFTKSRKKGEGGETQGLTQWNITNGKTLYTCVDFSMPPYGLHPSVLDLSKSDATSLGKPCRNLKVHPLILC